MQLFVRDKKFYQTLAAFALPIAAQQLITVGVNMADNIMLGQLGETSMSGATLANNFISLFQIMCMGFGMGASVLTSRFYGMKERNSLKKAINIMFLLELIVATLFAVATALIPGKIMGMFTTDADIIRAGTGYLLISIPCYYLNGYAMTTSIVLRRDPIIGAYKILPETKALAYELMDAVAIVVLFQSANSILTKGVLRGGRDTKFLMIVDILFLWVCSIPLGALAGLVFHWPGFWIYTML